MKIAQQLLSAPGQLQPLGGSLAGLHPQFALAFGSRGLLEDPRTFATLQQAYPGTRLLLASTSGEIHDTTVTDDHLIVTAVALERSRIACAATSVRTQFESHAAGRTLAQRLRGHGLSHVLVLSDGQLVNGTELARGFNETLPSGVVLTGGLAGDGLRFEKTVVGLDEAPTSGRIVALGFYGHRLKTGFGSCGGWTPLGDERTVTAASGNILFQLDGLPALDLYQHQLGADEAGALPASGLRYPLCVNPPDGSPSVVRSVLAVDASTRTMMFAGDMPTGSHVRFMQATHEHLVAGATQAARQALLPAIDLVICISCVGRRVVLGDRTSDELSAVRALVGPAPFLTGFYSYGELAPAHAASGCQLHNQTMTITSLREE